MDAMRVDLERAPSGELVGAARTILAVLATRPGPQDGAGAKDEAEALVALLDLAEAALAARVRRVDACGEVGRWGVASTGAWLRGLGMRPHRAKERLALARELERLPEVAERFTTGALSSGYAATICQAVQRLDDADAGKAEDILLDLSAKVSVGKVAVAARRITDLIAQRDGKDSDPEAARGYERSWVEATKALDGGKYVRGYLNAEDAGAWDGIVAPLARPAGADDRRNVTERTASAMMTALTRGTAGTRALVVLDLATLTGGPASARLADGTPIPAAQARRIVLNAGVSALVLGTKSVPLYLGNRVRFATAHQRRVLTALYDTCAVAGCEIPATLCEIDHIYGFALGNSPTDIDLLMPLCRWHNQYKNNHPHRVRVTTDPHNGRHTCRILPPGAPNTTTTPADPLGTSRRRSTDPEVVRRSESASVGPLGTSGRRCADPEVVRPSESASVGALHGSGRCRMDPEAVAPSEGAGLLAGAEVLAVQPTEHHGGPVAGEQVRGAGGIEHGGTGGDHGVDGVRGGSAANANGHGVERPAACHHTARPPPVGDGRESSTRRSGFWSPPPGREILTQVLDDLPPRRSSKNLGLRFELA